VKSLVNGRVPGIRVARTLFVADTAGDITPEVVGRMSGNYVVKASHGSQMTVLVSPTTARCLETTMSRQRKLCKGLDGKVAVTGDAAKRAAFIQATCKHWLSIDFGKVSHQPSYSHIKRTCVFEESLADAQGKLPDDVKVFVAHGRPLMLYVGTMARSKKMFVATDGSIIPVQQKRDTPGAVKDCALVGKAGGTAAFKAAKYVALAAVLGQGFPSVRVDFFADEDQPIFQELTFTSVNCKTALRPLAVSYLAGYVVRNPSAVIRSQCFRHVAIAAACGPPACDT